jgi:hypothetical protein
MATVSDLTELPFDTLPPPPYRPGTGRSLTVVGALFILTSLGLPASLFLYAASGPDLELNPNDPAGLGVVVFAALLSFTLVIVGALLIARGRQLRALPAQVLLAHDRREPILFLRSFDDDDLIDPTPRMVPLGDYFPRRYEESLAAALQAVGPMITIGRPGDQFELLGAGRLFVPDHAWKAAVAYLQARAAIVVLMVGRSEGIWWEITSSLTDIPRERLLFFFPYIEEAKKRRSVWQRLFFFHPANLPLSSRTYRRMELEREQRYALFRERVQPQLPGPLPGTLGSALFIDFQADGTPRALRTVRPWWWLVAIMTPSVRRMLVDYRRSLVPFVAKLK